DAQPASRQGTGLADVVEYSRVGKAGIGGFTQTITEFREYPGDSRAGVARVEFFAKAIGQLARHAEVVVKIGDRQRTVRAERVSLPAETAAADVRADMRPIRAAALGRDVDHAAESVAAENSRRAGQDFDPLDIFDRNQIEVDGVEV